MNMEFAIKQQIFANKQESVTTFNQIRINEDNTNAIIKLILEKVNDKDKGFTFAGNQFTVTKGGFKLSLSISNWLFKSNINTSQVQMTSDILYVGFQQYREINNPSSYNMAIEILKSNNFKITPISKPLQSTTNFTDDQIKRIACEMSDISYDLVEGIKVCTLDETIYTYLLDSDSKEKYIQDNNKSPVMCIPRKPHANGLLSLWLEPF
ncbi:hypothetical protein DICPUDRAFT_76228 [Dictyostelium purpureum]|uniref:ComC supersandwich domain-containing protein n=1 Tax=Dictyostelium purpureum TaxID=5786 RepID=F0ZCZ7_DICPU|nr:uncharacterized protein DICPUDRAFT_76228 [Dictyostelium purpureum]EGC38156.1 hypothetical protein DICPUDRAFT_76228 [Dictyostelium purpureum]|eukprot:XP_003285283.1 hypothetical protein DICPUDRAFT_76228 [Dictyostelium purpureum]